MPIFQNPLPSFFTRSLKKSFSLRFLLTQPKVLLLPNLWDALALILIGSVILALSFVFDHMTQPFKLGHIIPLSLSKWDLIPYGLDTVVRMFIALFFSFLFSLIIATLAAKNKKAEQVLIPLVDILQSVPILGYLSVAVVGFIALFPNSMLGPECAAIFAVFTSQVWNMTLSLYQSLKIIPKELSEAARCYHLSAWQRFWKLEFPFALPGLLWNAMISMSGGWFFIVASEAISVAHQNIYLPGIGSYIAMAILQGNLEAIIGAIAAMFIIIILYDQTIFRPLIAWSEKFKLDESLNPPSYSWMLNLLQNTRWIKKLAGFFNYLKYQFTHLDINFLKLFTFFTFFRPTLANFFVSNKQNKTIYFSNFSKKLSEKLWDCLWYISLGVLLLILFVILWRYIYQTIPLSQTLHIALLGLFTGLRVFIMLIIASLIWVPIGVSIGLRPKLAAWTMPLAQFLAAFPVNLFYPIAFFIIFYFKLNINIWSAPLMVLGTQWYILFNIVAGASAIPKELLLAAQSMQIRGWTRWKRVLLPAIFPYYITGAITAAGGSWNASIVAEIIQWGHIQLIATGLGSFITLKTREGDFPALTLGIVIMCIWVVLINLTLWRKLYQYTHERFSLEI